MELLYKVGDIVRIVPDLDLAGDRHAHSMKEWEGAFVTISELYDDDMCYGIKEDKTDNDSLGWSWCPEMIAELILPASVRLARYKPGDRVVIANEKRCYLKADKLSFVHPMSKWCGEVMTVSSVDSNNPTYHYMEETSNRCIWCSYMIEGLESELDFEAATDEADLMRLLL